MPSRRRVPIQSYVKMHPAHVVLTPAANQEAADAFYRPCIDWLLSHPQPIQPPWSQDECRALVRLRNDVTMFLHYLAISDTMIRCRSWPIVWSFIHARRYVPRSLFGIYLGGSTGVTFRRAQSRGSLRGWYLTSNRGT